MSLFLKTAFLLSLALVLANCGNQAAMRKTNGTVLTGTIAGSDSGNVYLNHSVGLVPIPKSEIDNIDHPGNGLAAAGVLVTAYGLLNIAVALPECRNRPAAFCVGVFLPAAVGLPMLVKGFTTWKTSTRNLEKPSPLARGSLSMHPVYAPGGAGATYGLMLLKPF